MEDIIFTGDILLLSAFALTLYVCQYAQNREKK